MENAFPNTETGEYGEARLYRLSDPQLGIWEAEMTYPETALYNYAVSVTFNEEINPAVLSKAVNLFIERNDGVHMRLTTQEGIPMQYAAAYEYKEIDFFDFTGRDSEDIRKWMEMRAKIPFSLLESELFYYAIIKRQDSKIILFIKVHHIIMDAWSLYNIMLNQLTEIYRSLEDNQDISVTVPSYEKYISENCELGTKPEYLQALRKSREFWSEEFRTLPGCMALKPGSASFASDRKVFLLPALLSDQMRLLSSRTGYSPFIIFLSALSIYIYRITAERDMVVGGITLNRLTDREKETFGMFVNTVPIRLVTDPDKDFYTYLGEVKKKWKQVVINQRYTINHITEDFRRLHKTSEKLFDVVLSYQNVKLDTKLIKYEVDMAASGQQTETLRIHISDREDSGSYMMEMEYLPDKLTEAEIDTLFTGLQSILSYVVKDPSIKLSCLPLLPDEERHRLLSEYNRTDTYYPKDSSLNCLFEEQAEKYPGNIALVYKETETTYEELNRRVNSLAGILRDKGVRPGDIVAILAERSVEMITAILAILKAGGTYLPLDPTFPGERLLLMLEDSQAQLLLVYGVEGGGPLHDKNDAWTCNIEVLSLADPKIYLGNGLNPNPAFHPENPAYIIYTSGSTGKPKGVAVGHGSVIRVVRNTNYIEITGEDRLLQLSNYAFDGSVFDIFGALLNGATLVIPEKEEASDAVRLTSFIKQKGITVFFVTAALFNVIVDTDIDCLKGTRKVLFGGERASAEHVLKAARYLGPGRLVNGYGPTESTVFATYYSVDSPESDTGFIPIGKPLSNTYVYILDEHGNVLPEGVTGELYISGDGLAIGYLNRPELTAEKFISNPFLQEHNPSGGKAGRMYKTGDLAKWMPDGNIEFVGRVDKQVKLRGYRIELGEIEACLKAHGGIKDAIVTLYDNHTGTKSLCAYLVTDNSTSFDELKSELENHAKRELPYYMVPACFIFLDDIPLTPNGKADIKALPAPEFTGNETSYMEPQNRLQEMIAAAWKKVLYADQYEEGKIGINDDFFHMGGHSLLAMKLALELQQMGISIKVTDIYENKTIARQADFILSKGEGLSYASAAQSFRLSEIKATSFKLIKSVVENNDSYTWQEVNCFYRPMAILYESYSEGYFDIFLFMASYYSTHMADGWFTGVFESDLLQEFIQFHEAVMKPKTGLSLKTESFKDEAEMHAKLKDALNDDSPVLVPIDLYGMYYTQGYLRGSHRHYLIVKGYDEERGLYHILDNMHIDNGAYTVYKDFSIRAEDLYSMNCLYFENCCPEAGDGFVWVLKKAEAFQKKEYSVHELLKDHLGRIRDIRNHKTEVHFLEYELYKRRETINLNEVNISFTVLNFKPVYYDLLYRMLRKCGAEERELAYMKAFTEEEANLRNDIKLLILDVVAGNDISDKELQLKFNRKEQLENEFMRKLEHTMESLDFYADRNAVPDRYASFRVKNHKGAEIIRAEDKIIFKLDSSRAYDTWDVHDNAPQMLIHPGTNENFFIETTVTLENNTIGPYQAGLIFFLKSGVKILYGMDKGHRMSVFCPEKGDEYTLYMENIMHNVIYLRMKKAGSVLSFYSKKAASEEWTKKYEVTECTDVSSCGIFAKTFEKTSFAAEFSELKFIKL
jgi:amino acid adenylation domain-containing protein